MIDRLKNENHQLKLDITRLTEQKEKRVSFQPEGGQIDSRNEKRRNAAQLILSGYLRKKKMAASGAFFRLKLNAEKKRHAFELKHVQNKKSSKVSDLDQSETESKLELQDEIFKLSQTQTDLVKSIGKIIRQVNQERPIKLQL